MKPDVLRRNGAMNDGHGAILGRSIDAAHRVIFGMSLGCRFSALCRPLSGRYCRSAVYAVVIYLRCSVRCKSLAGKDLSTMRSYMLGR